MTILEEALSKNLNEFFLVEENENFISYSSCFETVSPSTNTNTFLENIEKIHNHLHQSFENKFKYARLIIQIGLSDEISISLLDQHLTTSDKSLIKDSFLTFNTSEDKIFLKFKIDKELSTSNYILSLTSFKDYLMLLSLEENLEKWDFITKKEQRISFFFWENFNGFSSESILFCNINEKFFSDEILFKRTQLIEKRDKTSYFKNSKTTNLTPNDFNFNDNVIEGYKKYFDILKIVLTTIFLSDSSIVDDNTLTYRLKGYKLISESISFIFFDGFVNLDIVYCLLFRILIVTTVSIAKKTANIIKKLIF